MFKRELKICGSFALKKTFGKAVALAKSGKVSLLSLVDKRLTLDDAPKTFEDVLSGNAGLKTIFYPNGIEENK